MHMKVEVFVSLWITTPFETTFKAWINYQATHRRALKDISEALEQKCLAQKILVKHYEHSSKITMSACLSLKVCSKDDCDTTKRKDSYDTRRSKQKHITSGE